MHEHNITDSPMTLLPVILGILIVGMPIAYYCLEDYVSNLESNQVEQVKIEPVDDTILFDCGDLNLTYKI